MKAGRKAGKRKAQARVAARRAKAARPSARSGSRGSKRATDPAPKRVPMPSFSRRKTIGRKEIRSEGPACRVALVGMMGSGKSTVGIALAARLGLDFVDLDAEIERALGKPVARIFAEDGEAYFRNVESIALSEIAFQRPRAVFALGGGAVVTEQVRSALRDGLLAPFDATVWLAAPVTTLARRLEREEETGTRPLLAGLDAKAREGRLASLLEERRPLYDEVADYVVDTDGRTAEEVALEIAGRVAARRRLEPSAPEGGVRRRVLVEAGALALLGRRLRRAGCAARRVALVADATVEALHGARAEEGLRAAGLDVLRIAVPAGEAAKTFAVLERTLAAMAAARLDRSAWVVALGGGAATDVAGLAAATYLRGVAWASVPTTLLGMVDAAIGGKTGIDVGGRKNVVGVFHEPAITIADPETLATLPSREALSGLGEVWKYAIALDGERAGAAPLADLLRERVAPLLARGPEGARRVLEDPALLVPIVERCARIKMRVVAQDPREETGPRKALNFGHTIGHGLESAAAFAIPHGVCVAHGMRAALRLSRAKGLLDAAAHARLAGLLDLLPLPPVPKEIEVEAVLAAMKSDKKFRDGRMLFVLLEGEGAPRIDVEVSETEARDAIRGVRPAPEERGPS